MDVRSKKLKKELVKKYVLLSLGVLLSTSSVVLILRPNGLMTGGITGLSRIVETSLSKVTDWDSNLVFSISYYLLALLILFLAFIFLGKKDGMRIIVMSLVYPTMILLLTLMDVPKIIIQLPVEQDGVIIGYLQDTLIPAILYGVFAGSGSGLVVRSGFTTGGSDTIAKILYRRLLPFISIGILMLVVDSLVILSSIFVFDLHIVLYAFVSKFVYMKFVDIVVFGFGNNKVKIEILSHKNEEIKEYIMNTLKRGVTIHEAEGGYSHVRIAQIMCICSPRESLLIKKYIASVDPDAFVYITKIDSIWGRDFKSITLDELGDN